MSDGLRSYQDSLGYRLLIASAIGMILFSFQILGYWLLPISLALSLFGLLCIKTASHIPHDSCYGTSLNEPRQGLTSLS